MRNLWLCGLLALLFGLRIGPINAQGVLGTHEGEDWFFVQDFDSSEIIAYTLSGETRTLAATAPDFSTSPVRFRVDAETILAFASDDDETSLPYLLSVDEGVVPFDAPLIGDHLPVYYADPYLVLNNLLANRDGETIYVLDLETQRTLQLPGIISVIGKRDCCRINVGAGWLRYVAQAEAGEDAVQEIREFDLTTGSERILYTSPTAERAAIITPGPAGDYWLQRLDNAEKALLTLAADGSVSNQEVLTTEREVFVRIFADQLLIEQVRCEGNCTLEARPLAGGEARTFTTLDDEFGLQPIYSDDNALIGILNETYYRLTADSVAILGAINFRHLNPSTNIVMEGRFLLTLDQSTDPNEFLMHDNVMAEVVFTMPFVEEEFPLFTLYADGTLINLINLGRSGSASYVYDTVAETLTPFVVTDYIQNARPLRMFPDGEALVYKPRPANEEEPLAAGIYRLETATGAVTPLVLMERAFPLDGQPLDILAMR